MNKKILLKYMLMYLPFFVGGVMFSCGLVNVVSSLLLFVGGYVAIKNTFDYRIVRKNTNINVSKKDVSKKEYVKPINSENVIGLKRTRVYKKVRSRIR